jgi:hypothetical protein
VQNTGELFIYLFYFWKEEEWRGEKKMCGTMTVFATVADPLRCMNRKLG